MTSSSCAATLLVAAILWPGWTGWCAVPEGVPTNRDAPSSLPTHAVRSALQAEADGDNSTRNQLLKRVLSDDSDDASARWNLGYIRSGDQWVPYEQELDSTAGRRQSLVAYQQARTTAPDTVDGQLALASLARERGLADEERAHLRRVVALDWNQEEARHRLGDVFVDGFWITQDELSQFARELATTRAQRAVWDPRVQPIVRKLLRTPQRAWEEHWQELMVIRDPGAIPSVEAAVAYGDARGALQYLEWLDSIDAWEASVGLARQAVTAPASAIRSSAQRLLRAHQIDDYAPVLLGALRADPSFRSRYSLTPFGGLLYVEESSYETQADHRARRLAVLYGHEAIVFNTRTGPGTIARVDVTQNVMVGGRWETVIAHLRRYYGGFTRREGVARESSIEVVNDRIMRTLAAATRLGVPESPQDWWEWWAGYQGLHVDGAKPRLTAEYEESWYVDRRAEVRRTVTRFAQMSCFAAGTPVVTEDGPEPIEEIQLGDRVLSQDVESGELAFKPVFKTTVRPPVALMKVTTDRGELVCTGGHPFWVNGESWLYGRELQPGMRFHSIDGASEILLVEDAGREEKAYNLIVADFHTYFAGDGKILSHDNTPRTPTNALVPGLMPDYSSAEAAP